MDAAAAARRWAREWERAWREHDPERVASLYAPGASFRSSPFRELEDPRAYAEWAFGSEEPGGAVRFAEPVAVAGDRGAVEWWAVVRERGGPEATLAGISLLRFASGGLVLDQRDVWNHVEARRDPHPGWGV